METWTRQQLETEFPFGSVNVQNGEEIRSMTREEWNEWIDRQVGLERPEADTENYEEEPEE